MPRGDIHSKWVDELAAWDGVPENMGENPHLKWHTARRGYHVSEVRPDAWHTTYREVPVVTTPGAPVQSVSEWRTEYGRPGIVRVS